MFRMRKFKFRFAPLESRQVVALFVFTMLFSFMGLDGYSQARKKLAKNAPVFSDFVYEGKDQVYIDNPLKEDEFYTPILQGCYPDPSIARKGEDYYLVASSFAM